MELTDLSAISPIDGRYRAQCHELSSLFSEYGLMQHRLRVEVAWLLTLSDHPHISEVPSFTSVDRKALLNMVDQFSLSDAQAIKAIEQTTNHDVKAIEYTLKDKLQHLPSAKGALEFVHFACTSEDINNVAYALMLRTARSHHLQPVINKIKQTLTQLAHDYAASSMLARTHGQPASPTTMGKEIANSAARLQAQLQQFADVSILAKFNGAVGNFNAHHISYPEIDWLTISTNFLHQLELESNNFTTQIEPHDWIASYCHALLRVNTVLIDFCRDIWGYISLGYFSQRKRESDVGSSTMPHKVNPIDFENAEGNLGLANALLDYFAQRLPTSRWQRDLTDSTLLRNLGVALAHCLIGYRALLRGLDKLVLNDTQLAADLAQHWEVLAEAIQTVMRRYGIPEPYEKLKALTRGETLQAETLRAFIQSLDLPNSVKTQLLTLRPENYIGLAAELAKSLL